MEEQKSNGLLYVAVAGLGLVIMVAFLPLLLLGGGEDENGDPKPVSQCAAKEGSKTGVQVPKRYVEPLKKAAKTSGLPYSIHAAQIQAESAFNEKAQSPYANGPAQFIPDTWAAYGNGGSVWDIDDALDANGRYMRDLVKQVAPYAKSEEDKVKLSLAAYNAGPGAVAKYKGVPPYEETQNYVAKITRNAQVNYVKDCKPPVQNASAIDLGPGEWTNPLPGSHLTSGFGSRPCPLSSCAGKPYLMFHEGIDIAGGDDHFYAPTDMKITYVGKGITDPLWRFYGEYIYAVQVDEPHLVFEFHEAELGSLKVMQGQTVKAGTPLGKPGATGNSSGIHLHFQINRPGTNVTGPTVQNGKSMDPMRFLREKGVAPK